jgi:hypothetical protein
LSLFATPATTDRTLPLPLNSKRNNGSVAGYYEEAQGEQQGDETMEVRTNFYGGF